MTVHYYEVLPLGKTIMHNAVNVPEDEMIDIGRALENRKKMHFS